MNEFVIAILAVVLHVANYNATAQIEYNTKIFTKILGGRNYAVYIYAVYLVLSALLRDYFIESLLASSTTYILPHFSPQTEIGWALFISGILLNFWTLHALGIKGMYNGDSFGWLMDAPVTGGPYRFFNDPQYVGTTAAMLGATLKFGSGDGLIVTAWMGFVFWISVRFIEFPHMVKIYANKEKEKKN